MVYLCKVCRSAVTPNYDHVGDCAREGACPGTFEHPRMKPPGQCARANLDLEHGDVVAQPS